MADCPNPDGSSARRTKFDAPPPMCIDVEKAYHAEIVTSKGTMFVQLLPKRAPKTVNNFVFLARYHYFDGIIFHRIIKDFVIQGGDPEGTGRGGPGYRFPDELPKPGEYQLGSLVMANAGPDTHTRVFHVSGHGFKAYAKPRQLAILRHKPMTDSFNFLFRENRNVVKAFIRIL